MYFILIIVNKFVYLGITFSTGGASFETHKTVSGQALKAIFKLNQYFYQFTEISPRHTPDLYDKLITPTWEIWGFSKHLQQESSVRRFLV